MSGQPRRQSFDQWATGLGRERLPKVSLQPEADFGASSTSSDPFLPAKSSTLGLVSLSNATINATNSTTHATANSLSEEDLLLKTQTPNSNFSRSSKDSSGLREPRRVSLSLSASDDLEMNRSLRIRNTHANEDQCRPQILDRRKVHASTGIMGMANKSSILKSTRPLENATPHRQQTQQQQKDQQHRKGVYEVSKRPHGRSADERLPHASTFDQDYNQNTDQDKNMEKDGLQVDVMEQANEIYDRSSTHSLNLMGTSKSEIRRRQRSQSPLQIAAEQLRKDVEYELGLNPVTPSGAEFVSAKLPLSPLSSSSSSPVSPGSVVARAIDRVSWNGSPRTFESKVSAAISEKLHEQESDTSSDLAQEPSSDFNDFLFSKGSMNRSYRRGQVTFAPSPLKQRNEPRTRSADYGTADSSWMHIDHTGRVHKDSQKRLPAAVGSQPIQHQFSDLDLDVKDADEDEETSSSTPVSYGELSTSPLDYYPSPPSIELIRAWAAWKRFAWMRRHERKRQGLKTISLIRSRSSSSGMNRSVISTTGSTYSTISAATASAAAAVADRLRSQIEIALEERTRMAIQAGAQMLARAEERRARRMLGRGFQALRQRSVALFSPPLLQSNPSLESLKPEAKFPPSSEQVRLFRAGARMLQNIHQRWRLRVLRNVFTKLLRAAEHESRLDAQDRFQSKLAHVLIVQLEARFRKLSKFRAFNRIRLVAQEKLRRQSILGSTLRARRLRFLAYGFRILTIDNIAEADIDQANGALDRTRKVLDLVNHRIQKLELGHRTRLQQAGFKYLYQAIHSSQKRRTQRAFLHLHLHATMWNQARSFHAFRKWDELRSKRRTDELADSIENTCTDFAVRKIEQMHRAHALSQLCSRHRLYMLRYAMNRLRNGYDNAKLRESTIKWIMQKCVAVHRDILREAMSRLRANAHPSVQLRRTHRIGASILIRRLTRHSIRQKFCKWKYVDDLWKSLQRLSTISRHYILRIVFAKLRAFKASRRSTTESAARVRLRVASTLALWETFKKGSLKGAFLQIRTFAQHRRHLSYLVQRTLVCWRNARLFAAWTRLKCYCKETRSQIYAHAKLVRVLRRWRYAQLHRAFLTWSMQSLHQGIRTGAIHQTNQLRGAMMIWTWSLAHRVPEQRVEASFIHWKLVSDESARRQQQMRKVVLKMSRCLMLDGFHAFKSHSFHQQRVQYLLSRALTRLTHLNAFRAFSTWKTFSKSALKRKIASQQLFRTLSRWQRGLIAAALNKWKASALQRRSLDSLQKSSARTVILHWRAAQRQRCSSAFSKWRAWVQRSAHLGRVANQVAKRWAHNAIARAFRTWILFANFEYSRYGRLFAVCRRWYHLQLRMAFRKWYTLLRDEMTLFSVFSHYQLRQKTQAFQRWRSQLDLDTRRVILIRRLIARHLRNIVRHGFSAWVMATRADSGRDQVLSRIIKRWQKLRIRTAYNILRKWAHVGDRLAHGLQIVRSRLQRYAYRAQAYAWSKLVANVRNIQQVGRILAVWRLRYLRESFQRIRLAGAWGGKTEQAIRKVAVIWRRLRLQRALKVWCFTSHRAGLLKKTLAHWRSTRLSKAFLSWYQALQAARGQHRGLRILKTTLRNWRHHRIVYAWRKWLHYAYKSRTNLNAAEIVIQRWRFRGLSKAFSSWTALVEQRKNTRLLIVKRMLKSTLAESFRLWKSYTERQRNAYKIFRVLRRMQRQKVPRAFYTWKDVLSRHRRAESLSARISSDQHARTRRQTLAFWQLQAKEATSKQLVLQRLWKILQKNILHQSMRKWHLYLLRQDVLVRMEQIFKKSQSSLNLADQRQAFKLLQRHNAKQRRLKSVLRHRAQGLQAGAWLRWQKYVSIQNHKSLLLHHLVRASQNAFTRLAFSRWVRVTSLSTRRQLALRRACAKCFKRNLGVALSRWKLDLVFRRQYLLNSVILWRVLHRLYLKKVHVAFRKLSRALTPIAQTVLYHEHTIQNPQQRGVVQLSRMYDRVQCFKLKQSLHHWNNITLVSRSLVLSGIFVAWNSRVVQATMLRQRATRIICRKRKHRCLHYHLQAWRHVVHRTFYLNNSVAEFKKRQERKVLNDTFGDWYLAHLQGKRISDLSAKMRHRNIRQVLVSWGAQTTRQRKLRLILQRKLRALAQQTFSYWKELSFRVGQARFMLSWTLRKLSCRRIATQVRSSFTLWRDFTNRSRIKEQQRTLILARVLPTFDRTRHNAVRSAFKVLTTHASLRSKQIDAILQWKITCERVELSTAFRNLRGNSGLHALASVLNNLDQKTVIIHLANSIRIWQEFCEISRLRELRLFRVLKNWKFLQCKESLRRWRAATYRSSRNILLIMRLLRHARRRWLKQGLDSWLGFVQRQLRAKSCIHSICQSYSQYCCRSALHRLAQHAIQQRTLSHCVKNWRKLQMRQAWSSWLAHVFSRRVMILSTIFASARSIERRSNLQYGFHKLKCLLRYDHQRRIRFTRVTSVVRRLQLRRGFQILRCRTRKQSILGRFLTRVVRYSRQHELRVAFTKLLMNRWSQAVHSDVSRVIDLACSNSAASAEIMLQKHVALLASVDREFVKVRIALVRGHPLANRAHPGQQLYHIENRSGRSVASVTIAQRALSPIAEERIGQYLEQVGGIMGREWMNRVSRRGLQLRRCMKQMRLRLMRVGFVAFVRVVVYAQGQLDYAHNLAMVDSEELESRKESSSSYWDNWKSIRAVVGLGLVAVQLGAHRQRQLSVRVAFLRLVDHVKSFHVRREKSLPGILNQLMVCRAVIWWRKYHLSKAFHQWRSCSAWVHTHVKWATATYTLRQRLLLQQCFDGWYHFMMGIQRLRKVQFQNKQMAARALGLQMIAQVNRQGTRRADLFRAFSKLREHAAVRYSHAQIMMSVERIWEMQESHDFLRKSFYIWRASCADNAKQRLLGMVDLATEGYNQARNYNKSLLSKVDVARSFTAWSRYAILTRRSKDALLRRTFQSWARILRRNNLALILGVTRQRLQTEHSVFLRESFSHWASFVHAKIFIRRLFLRRLACCTKDILSLNFTQWKNYMQRLQHQSLALNKWHRVSTTVICRTSFRNWQAYTFIKNSRRASLCALVQKTHLLLSNTKIRMLRGFSKWRETVRLMNYSRTVVHRHRAAHAIWACIMQFQPLSLRSCLRLWALHCYESRKSDLRVIFTAWRNRAKITKARTSVIQARVILWKRQINPRRKLRRHFEAWRAFVCGRCTVMGLYELSARRQASRHLIASFAVWKSETSRAKAQRRHFRRMRLTRTLQLWRQYAHNSRVRRNILRRVVVRREKRALFEAMSQWRVQVERLRALMYKCVSESLSHQMVSAIHDKENKVGQLQAQQEESSQVLLQIKERAKTKIKSLLEENSRLHEVLRTREKENETLEMQTDEDRRALKCCEMQLIRAKEEAAELRRKSKVMYTTDQELSRLENYVCELESSNFELQSKYDQSLRRLQRREKKIKAMQDEADMLQMKLQQLSYISRVERESFCSTLISNMSMEEV